MCCKSGQSAIDIIMDRGEGAFDVLLLDICMPDMDGYQVAIEIRCASACQDHTDCMVSYMLPTASYIASSICI
jgi:CheY-like chemotaxis protein